MSRAGGLGIFETSSGETANGQREICPINDSGLPFGVNLPIRFLKDDAMLRFVCEAGIQQVCFGGDSEVAPALAGQPGGGAQLRLTATLRDFPAHAVAQVTCARHRPS